MRFPDPMLFAIIPVTSSRTPFRSILAAVSLLSASFICAGCASGTSVVATPGRPHFVESPVEESIGSAQATVNRGDDRDTVLARLGRPAATLGNDAWIYWNYGSFNPAANPGHSALVVFFSDKRVENLRLVDAEALRRHMERRAVAAVK